MMCGDVMRLERVGHGLGGVTWVCVWRVSCQCRAENWADVVCLKRKKSDVKMGEV